MKTIMAHMATEPESRSLEHRPMMARVGGFREVVVAGDHRIY